MISNLFFLLFVSVVWQEVVPYKPSNEYEVVIDFKFQDRPPDQQKAVYDVSEEKKKTTGLLPYLRLQVKLLKLNSEEIKVKVVNSKGDVMYNRKASIEAPIDLDIGFIDDVKDGVSPHEFTVLLYSNSKKTISQIKMVVMEDGTFMVNNTRKGKF